MSGSITRLGCLFFEWQPIRYLDATALKVWLVIYTQCDIPGLWRCDLPDIASKSFLSAEETLRALDTLRDAELIEFDRQQRVLRLTQLPDAGEWPSSPNIMRSWWSIFERRIPRCDVRDAHVTTLRWLLEEGARHSPKNRARTPSAAHEEMWEETFATVAIPSRRARGVRRFQDADTSTPEQPSLFGSSDSNPIPSALPSGSGPDDDTRKPVRNDFTHSESHLDGMLRDQRLRSETENRDLSSGSGSASGSPEQIPETTPRANVLKLVPPADPAADLRRKLVNSFAGRVNAARTRVAEKFGIAGQVRPIALQGGEQTLVERLRESQDPEGDLTHVLEIAEAEAEESNGELRWLSWSLAEPKAWRNRLSATLSEVRKKRRDARGFEEGESVFDVVRETAAKISASRKTRTTLE